MKQMCFVSFEKKILILSVFSPTKADFIRAKHQQLAFIVRSSDSEDDLNQQLHSSVRTNNLETSLRLLAQGCDPNYFHQVRKLLKFVLSIFCLFSFSILAQLTMCIYFICVKHFM